MAPTNSGHIRDVIRLRPVRRRALAALAIVFLTLSGVEATIAETHDGDATAAELAQTTDHPGESAPASSDTATLPEGAGHSAHVCHWGHAHAGWVVPVLAFPSSATLRRTELSSARQVLHSITHTPGIRPPIE